MVVNAPCLSARLFLDPFSIYGWARAPPLTEDATYMHVTSPSFTEIIMIMGRHQGIPQNLTRDDIVLAQAHVGLKFDILKFNTSALSLCNKLTNIRTYLQSYSIAIHEFKKLCIWLS